MDEIQAAVLSVKLKYLDQDNLRRKEIANYYDDNIRNEAISTMKHDNTDNVRHIYTILSANRDSIQQQLAENNIATMIHYHIPPHHQACYKQWANLQLPITETIHRQELSLPCNQAMTDEEVEWVVECANKVLG